MEGQTVASALTAVLKNTYALYYKTQNYHWNVEGPTFASLHALFEDQYNELRTEIDDVAELIRGLDRKVTVSLSEIAGNNGIGEVKYRGTADEMVADLVDGHAAVEDKLLAALDAAKSASDDVVAGFVTECLTRHRKTRWMLKSSVSVH